MSRGTDRSREARLWVSTALMLFSMAAIAASNPYVICKVKETKHKAENWFKEKKAKREEKRRPHIEVVESETIYQEPL